MRLPLLNDVFERTYRIDAVLGEGGFATVFRAKDLTTGRDVALKILRPTDGRYPSDVAARFDREAQLVARLRDPHTVLLYDHGRDQSGLLWMAFEFVEGRDLSALLAEGVKLPEDAVLHILRQVLAALREAHAHGLVHRDIKPDNIRVFEYAGDPLRVKLLDFGVAREAALDGQGTITKTGILVGTPRYMSPEQLRFQPLTPASDIYSLGIVAYEMLVGPAAMHGHRLGDQIARLGEADALRLPANVDERLRAVIGRMVAPNADERFQTAREVLHALSAGAGAEEAKPHRESPAPAPRAAAAPAPAQQARRVLALAALGLAFGAALASLLLARTEPTAPAPMPRRNDALARILTTPPTRTAATPTDAGADAATPADLPEAPPPEPLETQWPPDRYEGPDGCGKKPPFAWHGDILAADGLDVRIELPGRYDPDYRHPVVLVFAGVGTSVRLHADMRIGQVASDERVIFAGVWNKPLHPLSTAVAPAVLDAVRATFCVDPQRVYAVGDSNIGGEVVEALACEMPLRAYATANYRSDPSPICRPRRRVPSIHFAALNDGYLPVEGGPGCADDIVISLADREAQLRDTHRCSAEREIWRRDGATECWTWACEAPLVSCHVDGGRGWDGKTKRRSSDWKGCDGEPPRFPMAATMWKFFEEQGR